MDSVYESRNRLFIALCHSTLWIDVYKTRVNADGSADPDWFILIKGRKDSGRQISYHLPMRMWSRCEHATEIASASSVYDGHTTDVVHNRLELMYG